MSTPLTRRSLLGTATGLAGAALVPAIARAADAPVPAAPSFRHQPPIVPLVFGHRGACALRPEHTLGSYQQAVELGVDFIEPDLVVTRDGVLVVRHENNIAETTNVADHREFASRRTVKIVDGERQEGWFTEDFTLDELKSLRAKERLPKLRPQNTAWDGQYPVMTFDEVVEFAATAAARRPRTLGIIPEIKHSTYFKGLGFDMEKLFLDRVKQHGWLTTAPMIVQSFEVGNLQRLAREFAGQDNVQLMQLLDDDDKHPADIAAANGALTYGAMVTPEGLATVRTYADWVCQWTRRVIALDDLGRLGRRLPLVADAHRAGLMSAVYTFRPEPEYLPAEYHLCPTERQCVDGSLQEIRRYIRTGLEGFFSDDPRPARRACDEAIPG